jgi:transcriptional regulator with XRE-family HTH domain
MKEKLAVQKKFGKHLKKLRLDRKITAAELAKRTEIEPSHISRLEAGESNPTLYTLTIIANALDITLEELFKGF